MNKFIAARFSSKRNRIVGYLDAVEEQAAENSANIQILDDTTYSKTETDALLNASISNLVGDAQQALDTLGEISDALNDDSNFAATMTNELGLRYTKTQADQLFANESSARQAAINTLTTDLNDEEQARIAQDTQLSADIVSEASTRSTAITALQNSKTDLTAHTALSSTVTTNTASISTNSTAISDRYTKAEVDQAFSLEEKRSDDFTMQNCYTKTVVDSKFADEEKERDIAIHNAYEDTEDVYVNSSYTGSIQNGKPHRPYTSLGAALDEKLVQGSNTHYTFYLSAGTYTGTINESMTSATQKISICGAGKDLTIIEGSPSWHPAVGNVLYLREFLSVELRDLTVCRGAYGFYPRNCGRVKIENVLFRECGSSGLEANHAFTNSQAQMAALWAGNTTNDGGAMRIRQCDEVDIQNSEVRRCLRGMRVQDCVRGSTSNNRIYQTLESGIYLASGSYGTQLDGSIDFQICGNFVQEAFNNGILIIGGKNVAISGNYVSGCANAGIQLWQPVNVVVHSNVVENCARLSYNGVGNSGDSSSNVSVAFLQVAPAHTGIYHAIITSNVITRCGQGNASTVTGVKISDSHGVCNKLFVHEDNKCDAFLKFSNPDNKAITTLGSGGGSVDLSAYSTTTQVNSLIAAAATDLSSYSTTAQMNSAITNATSGLVTTATLNNYIPATGIASLLADKQNNIGDGDLTIARTSGLQNELNTKLTPTITQDISLAKSATDVAHISFQEAGNNGSHSVNLQAPLAIDNTYSLTLPANPGSAGQFLQTDGNGTTTWASGGGGGNSSSNRWLIGGGVDFTPHLNAMSFPYPNVMEKDKKYFVIGQSYFVRGSHTNSSASSFWTLPAVNTWDVGDSAMFYNATYSSNIIIVTHARGATSNTSTTSQMIRDERLSGPGTFSFQKKQNTGRTFICILVGRDSNNAEDWLLTHYR